MSELVECPRCNEHGPFLPAGIFYNPEAARDLHQAGHAFTAALSEAFGRVVGVDLTGAKVKWRDPA